MRGIFTARRFFASAGELRGCPDARMPAACDDLLVRPTVVIVDDDSGFRSLARALLEAEGFDAIETAVYFICSEALANVGKYARASRAELAVGAEGGLVTVLVADDGVGGADPSAGSGLNGVADRVEALGGRFLVDSPAGGGTRLLAEIPASARQ